MYRLRELWRWHLHARHCPQCKRRKLLGVWLGGPWLALVTHGSQYCPRCVRRAWLRERLRAYGCEVLA